MDVCQQHLLLQDLHPLPFLEAEVPSVHRLVVVECQHHAVPQACRRELPGHLSLCWDGVPSHSCHEHWPGPPQYPAPPSSSCHIWPFRGAQSSHPTMTGSVLL